MLMNYVKKLCLFIRAGLTKRQGFWLGRDLQKTVFPAADRGESLFPEMNPVENHVNELC